MAAFGSCDRLSRDAFGKYWLGTREISSIRIVVEHGRNSRAHGVGVRVVPGFHICWYDASGVRDGAIKQGAATQLGILLKTAVAEVARRGRQVAHGEDPLCCVRSAGDQNQSGFRWTSR